MQSPPSPVPRACQETWFRPRNDLKYARAMDDERSNLERLREKRLQRREQQRHQLERKQLESNKRRADQSSRLATTTFVIGLVVGLLVGGGVVWYFAPGNSPNAGLKTMPDACVHAIREDFFAYWAADAQGVPGPGSTNFDARGPKAEAYNNHADDAFACQESFPGEPSINRLTEGDSSFPPPLTP